MKKKVILVLLMLFTAFGVVACTEITTGTTTADVTEQIGAPQNLRISGKVLSWDAVPGVTVYKVYVNGVEHATVLSATSYDFTSLTGDSILFNVLAVGPSGYNDSELSASLAYVVNPAVVIAAINLIADEEGMDIPEGVVEELVAKGITGPIFQNDVDAVQAFQTSMQTAEGDVTAMNLALSTFVDDVTNYEAYISAFLIAVPDMIDEEIAGLEEDRVWYEDMLDQYPDYQSQIDAIDAEIASLTSVKAAVLENSEQIVTTVMAVVNYLLDFHALISDELIASIQTVAEDENATGAEIALVKDEVTTLLLENLPSVNDLTLVTELLIIFGNAMDENVDIDVELANEYANASHISMELGVRFLASLNAAWIDEMMALGGEGMTSMEADTERQILFITAFGAFKDANQTLIDSLDAVFTEAQKQASFEAMLSSYAIMLTAQGMSEEDAAIIEEVLADLSYALANAGIDVFDDLGTKAFDYIVDSDGELLRKISIQNGFYEDYYYGTYSNDYTGETYPTMTAFKYAQQLNQAELFAQIAGLIDATAATLTEAQITAIVDMAVALAPEDFLATQSEQTVATINALLAALDAAITAQDQNAILLIHDIASYIVTNDVFGDYADLVTAVHAHNVTAFGADYKTTEYDKTYETYAYAIFMAHHLDAMLSAADETAIDALVAAVFDYMGSADFLAASGMTAQDLIDMEDMITTMINDVIAQAAVIAGYDYTALTVGQQTEVQDFMDIVAGTFGGGN